jgi:tetratricopeptide (TPR) repeat protein
MSRHSPLPSASPTKTPPPAAAWPSWRGRDWWLVGAVFAAVLLAYQPVWHAGFIWDDDSHLTVNPCIVGPLGFTGIWGSAAANYFPLTTTTLWLLHALWGLNPLPYHVVSVLFHAVGAVLLWQVLCRLHVRGAWLGSLLWALHPVQVESVAWISELKNTQSAVFYLLAIWWFLDWIREEAPSGRPANNLRYVLALLCAVLAILSKASTVMLPVVLGLCWWWTIGKLRWRHLVWLAPFFAISAVASGWTIWEQQFHAGAIGPDWNQSGLERLIIAGQAIWFYLGKLVWPHPLIFIYPRWVPAAGTLTAYLPALAAAVAGLVLWRYRRPLRPGLFAATYFGVSLFPVLGFFNVYFFRYSFVGDHFQYLASMGPLALAGAAIVTISDRLAARRPWLVRAICGLLVLGWGALTWRQARAYADADTLWRATLDEDPRCWMAHNNLGGLEVKGARYAEAINHLTEALRLHPGIVEAEYNLGLALLRTGRPGEATPHFEEVLRVQPADAEALGNLGYALFQLGRVPEAILRYEAALRSKPDSAVVHNNLGTALLEQRRIGDAIGHLQAAVRLDPDYPDARYNLGSALIETGRTEEGIGQLQQVVRANPADVPAHHILGVALSLLGRWPEAIVHLEAALRLKPDSAALHSSLGNALLEVGQTQEAIIHFEEALRLNPGLPQAREGLELARRQVRP